MSSVEVEIKRLNTGNACYHSVQNLSPSSLLCEKGQIGIYNTIILPVVLFGHETRYQGGNAD
jgi:hypothetical protein